MAKNSTAQPTHKQLKALEKTVQRLIDWPGLDSYVRSGRVMKADLYHVLQVSKQIRDDFIDYSGKSEPWS